MNSINVAILICLVASVSAGTLKISVPDCPMICPKLFDPICASNGNEARLFHSECHMKKTNCRDLPEKSEVFSPREMDLCTSKTTLQKALPEFSNCMQTCPLLFKPICAKNGKETKMFNSECHMKMTNCRNLSGKTNAFMPCELEQCQTKKVKNQQSSVSSTHILSQCPLICPQIYMPICASNGMEAKRFASECHMLQANCRQLTTKKDIYTPRETELCDNVEANKPLAITSNFHETKCLRSCPRAYQPVCGVYGAQSRTFSSQCLMDTHNCLSNENWLVAKTEEC